MTSTSSVNRNLIAALGRVEDRLKANLRTQDGFTQKYFQHAAAGRGKRLRARLVLLMAQAAGKITPAHERYAAAMELFHHATLVHDDIIDHADQRRNRSSLNSRFGTEISVLVGDMLFTRVMGLLMDRMPAGVQELAAQTAFQVCLGEMQEIHYRNKLEVTQAQYLELIENKTACLFAACCQGSLRLSQASKAKVAGANKFGQAFGLAFQIQDDVLDWTSQTHKLGKPVGADLKEGRITLPLILGLQEHDPELKAELKGKQRSAVIKQRLKQSGALQAAQASVQRYAERAKGALKVFANSLAKEELTRLAASAAQREK